jgi:glycosyltransferase involved in cell wall biosynthesis/ubiquinone/menaquinone biosynthesis C-methylase UbiE
LNGARRERFSSMPPQPEHDQTTERYTFRFDAPIPRKFYGARYDLSGWLVDTTAAPITGIRALVRRPLKRKKIFAARRKRSRPDVAVGFPHLPEGRTSGFLLELELGSGRNHLTLQVRDEQRAWRTFHTATIYVHRLRLLDALGFERTHKLVLSDLQRRYDENTKVFAPSAVSAASSQPSRYKRIDLFATTKSNLFILEIGELIAAGFGEAGYKSRLLLDALPQHEPPADTLQIIITPHEYYNLFLTPKVSTAAAMALTRNVVLFCTEQPDTGWFYNNLPWAYQAKAVADINSLGAIAYRKQGVHSCHFQLGYHDILAPSRAITNASREFDITFLGAFTPRREHFFTEHAPFFSSHKCHLRFVPLSFAKTNITRSYLPAEKRNELLTQSKVLLNLHYSERGYFEWHRALLALANGCCLITETAEGYGNLVPGKHFVMADRNDLIDCCDYFLKHQREAEAIALAGGDYIRHHLRQAQTCEAFLSALERRDCDNAEDVPPEPLPQSLRRQLKQRWKKDLRTAIAEDFRNFGGRKVNRQVKTDQEVILPKEHVIERRLAYKKRLREQDLEREHGKQPWQFHDNDLYRSSSEPVLTVLVTLFNYAHHIADCLQSIEQAAGNVSAAVELLVVNDASTDDSLDATLRYQQATKLPMRIVDKYYNTGLADARNVGTQITRGRYVFMMDADNLVYPGALSQLLHAISNENAAAAFSILCRFKGTEKNRVGLLSYYDWDPQILVQQPYIDAMAMFRRDVLLEFKYDTELNQIGWFGWEDYELWLRLVQRNYQVAFVPNILCLYRHHDASMINLTNLFEIDLVEHFIDRFDDLAARFEPHEMLFGVSRESIPSLKAAATRQWIEKIERLEAERDSLWQKLQEQPPTLATDAALRRHQYKAVWTKLSETEKSAKMHVAGFEEESRFELAGIETREKLIGTVGIHDDDVVVEIGCGVGRVGKQLAPICRKWIGCDVSPHMLALARTRLAGIDNFELHEISGFDLSPLPNESADVVYATVVFMHLEEWDRYSYVLEAHRVLRPGGRIFVDNVNLCSDDGWKVFEVHRQFAPDQRPPHITRHSTPAELKTYLERAGFRDIQSREAGEWIEVWGVK